MEILDENRGVEPAAPTPLKLLLWAVSIVTAVGSLERCHPFIRKIFWHTIHILFLPKWWLPLRYYLIVAAASGGIALLIFGVLNLCFQWIHWRDRAMAAMAFALFFWFLLLGHVYEIW